jgi:predicted transcriptional regulator
MSRNTGEKFNRVLFIRVDDGLLSKLDALVERVRSTSPNPVSRSSVVRDLLWDGVNAELKAWEEGRQD